MSATKRPKPRGIPAALILASGISRHGVNCECCYCRAEYAHPLRREVAEALTGEAVRP